MKPVYTERIETHMCFQACLASILEVDLTAPPPRRGGCNDFEATERWLEFYDVTYLWLEADPGVPRPRGWSIGCTHPPIAQGVGHCVVCFDGVLVFDPSELDDPGPVEGWFTLRAVGFRTSNHWLLGAPLGVDLLTLDGRCGQSGDELLLATPGIDA